MKDDECSPPPALTRVNWSYNIIFFSHPLGWSPSIFSLFQVKRQGKLFVYYQPLFECVWSAGWLMFPLHNQHKSVCGLWILSRTLKSFSFVNIVSSPMISISWLVAVRGFGSPDLTGPHLTLLLCTIFAGIILMWQPVSATNLYPAKHLTLLTLATNFELLYIMIFYWVFFFYIHCLEQSDQLLNFFFIAFCCPLYLSCSVPIIFSLLFSLSSSFRSLSSARSSSSTVWSAVSSSNSLLSILGLSLYQL